MAYYLARICWNTRKWVAPTGEAKRCETGSYVAKNGFGHEEWLFNFAWQLQGKHYAHLTPVAKSYKKVAGRTIDLLLFTISPNHERSYTAELRQVEVLRESDANTAVDEYRRRGWFGEMLEQVKAVGGATTGLEKGGALDLFNVRFAPDQARILEPRRRPVLPSKFTSARHRYLLYTAPESDAEELSRTRLPRATPLPTEPTTRCAQPETNVERTHNALQNHLADLLRSKYGAKAVSVEEDWIDITVRLGDQTAIIEVKTEPDARLAVRSAIGQLLEYAYYPSRKRHGQLRLHIVSPAAPSHEINQYLQTLSEDFQLRLSYHPFSLETESCPL